MLTSAKVLTVPYHKGIYNKSDYKTAQDMSKDIGSAWGHSIQNDIDRTQRLKAINMIHSL